MKLLSRESLGMLKCQWLGAAGAGKHRDARPRPRYGCSSDFPKSAIALAMHR